MNYALAFASYTVLSPLADRCNYLHPSKAVEAIGLTLFHQKYLNDYLRVILYAGGYKVDRLTY
jgi:hypothetical protein